MPDPSSPPKTGTLMRAANGDVIAYDESGLILHLADRVIADIAARLPVPPEAPAPPVPQPLPDDLDIWSVQHDGDWTHFHGNLPGGDSARAYRRHATGGGLIAEARGPLLALLAIGGARAALASPGPGRFPYHVLTPADDIGAVGMAGDGSAPATALMQNLTELTHEALIADALLARRRAASLSLPLFFVRAETDRAAGAADLASGEALANFNLALANLKAAAASLGTTAQVLAVTLDFVLEDVTGDPVAYRDGMLALMERITQSLARNGLARPIFLAAFDCGTHSITEGPALIGQWELAWNHADHRLHFTAPSYAFPMDDTGRLTDEGRHLKAQIAAEALLAIQAEDRWECPTIQLAERHGDDIRLVCESAAPLVIDPADPFAAGAFAGFQLSGVTNGGTIRTVEIDPDDPKSVFLRCTRRPEGTEIEVTYAHGAAPQPGPFPANRGALRDTWSSNGLHRWALPARLRLTDGQA
ncbi:MAG: hypothetical protein U1E06_00460 [Tabrizicola sp.]|uniref:hypothetical protein n=1 Tax=Tabrizicola sp. TaxID=2005166 RepID=UPI002736112F|nr:hypothetical protein [Tabrizicola sp.]MDP3262562.1 hypothetical protein [Tabrizicola sp.]MDP3648418.1 hypothetical protein [Paracoccaceae bacterium]MDZ4065321.1 hypothetical protein [Tabrizicola sp.]